MTSFVPTIRRNVAENAVIVMIATVNAMTMTIVMTVEVIALMTVIAMVGEVAIVMIINQIVFVR